MELLIGISREARLRVIELGKNWSHFLILGCALLLGGGLAITLPLITHYKADQVVGWTFLACGFFQLFQALRVRGTTTFRWWLVFGVILVLLAIAILRNPLENLSTVHLVTGLLVGLGLLKIIYAHHLRPAREWSWLLLSGVISLGLAALLITHLLPDDLKLSILLAIELMSAGLCLILIGWGFNTMNERLIKQVV